MLIFDLETNSKRPDAVSRVWCVATLDPSSGAERAFGPHEIPEALAELSQADELAGHNVSEYDLRVLERLYGFHFEGRVVDTLILSRLIYNGLSEEPDRHGRHALGDWGSRLHFRKGDWQNFGHWDPGMLEYCRRDCRVTARLLDRLREASPSPEAVSLELRYAAYMRRIEQHGFRFDHDACVKLQGRLRRRMDSVQQHLDRIFPPQTVEGKRPAWFTFELREAGLFDDEPLEIPRFKTKREAEVWRKAQRLKKRDVDLIEGPPEQKTVHFNPLSSTQVIKQLWGLGWRPVRENASGSIHTGELALWHSGLPAGKLIACSRAYSKLEGFTRQWLNHERDGRLYPRFSSNRAATNRSSSRSPNLQQIPRGGERESGMRLARRFGPACRALFRPRDGCVLVGGDLKSVEVRLLAHRLMPLDDGALARVACDPAGDIHAHNARLIGIDRDAAKKTLYMSMYGGGASSLSLRLGVTASRARDIIEQFTTKLPGFAELKRSLQQEHRQTGRIELIDRRRIQVSSAHKLLNFAIQGDAGILFKAWMLELQQQLEGSSYRLLCVIHDEAQAECSPAEVELVERCFRTSAQLVGRKLGFRVPIEADVKQGSSWAETH